MLNICIYIQPPTYNIKNTYTHIDVGYIDTNYTTDKGAQYSVSGATCILGKINICSSKTHKSISLPSTESEWIDVSECGQEVSI